MAFGESQPPYPKMWLLLWHTQLVLAALFSPEGLCLFQELVWSPPPDASCSACQKLSFSQGLYLSGLVLEEPRFCCCFCAETDTASPAQTGVGEPE